MLQTTRARSAGFTLLEMLVVLVIIGLLVSLVGPRMFAKVDTAKVQTAEAQLKLLRGAVETMKLDINRYPTKEEGLQALVTKPDSGQATSRWNGPYLEGAVPMDPWGNPYYYAPPEVSGQPFDLYSLGADGQPGGEGLDTDIGRDLYASKTK